MERIFHGRNDEAYVFRQDKVRHLIPRLPFIPGVSIRGSQDDASYLQRESERF